MGEKETPSDVIETDEGKEPKRATGQNQRERRKKQTKKTLTKKMNFLGSDFSQVCAAAESLRAYVRTCKSVLLVEWTLSNPEAKRLRKKMKSERSYDGKTKLQKWLKNGVYRETSRLGFGLPNTRIAAHYHRHIHGWIEHDMLRVEIVVA